MAVKQLIDKIVPFGFINVQKNNFIHRDCQVKSKLPNTTLLSFAKEARINKIFAIGTSDCNDGIPNICRFSDEINTFCQ